jgi:hypothetical protein
MDMAIVVLMVGVPPIGCHRRLAPAKALKDDGHRRIKLRLPEGFIGQLIEPAFVVDRVSLRVHTGSIASPVKLVGSQELAP